MRVSRLVALEVGVVSACLGLTAPAFAQHSSAPLSLSAVAIGPDDPMGPGNTQSGSVTIVIERWTDGSGTPERSSSGFVRAGSRVIAQIVSAREEADSETEGRRIVFVTDKPVSEWLIHEQPRPLDGRGDRKVESATFEIRLSKYGTGDGHLVDNSGAGVGPPIRFSAVSVDREPDSKR